MSMKQAQAFILNKAEKAITKTAVDFNATIKIAWPVDTGKSRAAWTLDKVSNLHWEVKNDVDYSGILWAGRQYTGTKWIGSNQMPAGGLPIFLGSMNRFQEYYKQG